MSTWETVALKDVARIERLGVNPADLPPDTYYLGLEHIARGGEIIGSSTNQQAKLASTKFKFDENHVLFGKLRPNLGKIARPKTPGICSTDILPIRPGPHLESSYLLYFLRQPSMISFAASRASGANLPRLSPTSLGSFKLPLPSVETQRRIASILDEADAIRAKRRAQIAHLDGLPQALFHQMFNAVTETQPLRDLLTETRYGTSNKSSDNGTPTLRIPNVVNGSLDLRDMKKVRISEGEFAQLQLLEGDILFVRSNGNPENTGRCAVFDLEAVRSAGLDPDKMIYASYLIRARLSQASPTYVCAFMESPEGRRQLRDRSNTSAGQYNLNSTNLGTVKIPIVPAEHQRDFANKVAAVKEERDRAIRALEADNELFAALQHRAFCGKL